MKRLLAIAVASALILALAGCGVYVEEAGDDKKDTSMFVVVEDSFNWRVVYHRDTKVMYIVGNCGTKGVFTVLVNPDGTPMLWDGE